MCEQTGTGGNVKQDDLTPIEYIDGYESGELKELLTPARGEEKTEDFRARYLSIVAAAQAKIKGIAPVLVIEGGMYKLFYTTEPTKAAAEKLLKTIKDAGLSAEIKGLE